MYKLLITDDETVIRNGLKNLIEWEVYGIEIVGEAEDGMKAYRKAKELEPDIILLDISMPNMTGLELMEMCSHLQHSPKFIVLSGYNDFQYVQKAMQFGAVNYLLKPVNQEELTQTIISTVKLLDSMAAHHQQFQESLETLRNNVLLRVLHKRIDGRELREKCQVVGISLHCSHMRVALFRPIDKGQSLFPGINKCLQICSHLCPCYALSDTDDCIGIIFKDQTHSLADRDYQRVLASCVDFFCKELGISVVTALGKEAAHIQELSDSHDDCLSQIEKNLILGSSLQQEISGTTYTPTVSYSDFVRFLEAENQKQVRDTIHSYFTDILSSDMSQNMDLLKYHLIELVTYVMHSKYMISFSDAEKVQKKNHAFSIISGTDSILKLEENLNLFFLALSERSIIPVSETSYSFMVQSALSFVNNNLGDDNLSLKTLAAELEVNAAYLGREFARETGEFFNDYLNRLRIAKALHLLSTTTWKTSKIANSVGFVNISYFFTIFKKITGQSPGDYRSTHG